MKRDPITVRPDTPFLEIQRLFVQAHIGGAPVVDADGRVEGMITSSDLLRALDELCDEDLDDAEPEDEQALLDRLATLTAREVETPEAIWVAPDTPLAEVAKRMRDEAVHRVLVGEDGKLAGILTAFDLLEAVKA
jgi:CBS domain-containing protein